MFKIIGADGREYGPVSADTIKEWISHGRANAGTRVLAEGATEWRPLSTFLEFADALSRPAASAPPAFATNAPASAAPPPTPLPADIETRDYSLDIGRCFGRGWELVMKNFWLMVGASFVLGLIAGAVGLIAAVCYGGMYALVLKLLRGQKAEFGDAFAGFSVAFLQLFLLGLVKGILTGLGIILCILPGIYLAVIWSFAMPLVMDKRMDFWPAMELSRKVVNKHWWQVFAMWLVSILVWFVGACVLCIGSFVARPVVTAAWTCAYEDIFCSNSSIPASNCTGPSDMTGTTSSVTASAEAQLNLRRWC